MATVDKSSECGGSDKGDGDGDGLMFFFEARWRFRPSMEFWFHASESVGIGHFAHWKKFCQVSNSHNFSLACPLALSHRHASLFQLQVHCPLSPLRRASLFFIANCPNYRCITHSFSLSPLRRVSLSITSYSGHRSILPALPLRRTSLFHFKQLQLQIHYLFSFPRRCTTLATGAMPAEFRRARIRT